MAGFAVLMRVEPTGRCALGRGKGDRAAGARFNNPLRPTVHIPRHFQTMPVHGGLFGEMVTDINGNGFALLKLDGGP